MGKHLRSIGVLLGVAVLVGCTTMVTLPDGTEMPESTYIATKSMQDKKEARKENLTRLMEGFQECKNDENMAKDEYKDCQHTNQLWLVQVPWLAQSLDDGGVDPGYWQLVNAREARRDPLRYVTAVTQVTQTLCLTGLFNCQGYGGGGDRIEITANDKGSVNADIVTGNNSPFVNGSDNLTAAGKSGAAEDDGMVATDDGQNVRDNRGTNVQQAGTDPPNANFAEGENQTFQPNSSTGISPDLP